VIQTHGFRTGRFSMDGLNDWGTGFAARALAAQGFLVLQSSMFAENTPQEGQNEMKRYEGAIDYLDGLGFIERHHVGIVGFSRGFYEVGYTLTHSKYAFAAAVLADGIDAGYFSYLSREHPGYISLNGGQPFREGLRLWLENSPTFSLGNIHTPVRLEAHGQSSGVLGLWEWFSGLSQRNKPVELIYLPDAPHLVVKPWEQMTAEQGLVDWFRFWLKDEEDSDPAKCQQYVRWRILKRSNFSENAGAGN
jgi:dipeptidyl aminopeptidase/acylaminoacyl peptidase